MQFAIQTQPSLRWVSYVFSYIYTIFHALIRDKYIIFINSDTRNHLFPNKLSSPASATTEGKKPLCRLITFCAFGKTGRWSDGKMFNHIGCVANNVKKCFHQPKKSSN